jgi:uncharacterized protein with NAD-binding domain and iron-sulfur cluster
MPTGRNVCVLGGGIAGLTAAHELVERGFAVTVYEAGAEPGGKARSFPVPNTGVGGRKDLPGEHGFRFFPSFYKHIPDSMRRIPYGAGTTEDQLVNTKEVEVRRRGEPVVELKASFPDTWEEWKRNFRLLHANLGIPAAEIEHFIGRMTLFMSTCEARRLAEIENQSWWNWVGAPGRSPAYQKYLAIGLTRTLTAMRPQEASARTVAMTLVQLIFPFFTPGDTPDRILIGPTNDVWIDPWVTHLQQRGVTFHFNAPAQGLRVASGRINGVDVTLNGVPQVVTADHYLAAVPVEVMSRWIAATPQLVLLDPTLAGIPTQNTEWIAGIQFYLRRPTRYSQGHTIYIDSPWAVTSIAQAQFWGAFDLTQYGDGQVVEILSVDVSDWETPSVRNRGPGQPTNLSANEATRQQLIDEVWAQIEEHVNVPGEVNRIDRADVIAVHVDPAIHFPPAGGLSTNDTSLLVNLPGSFARRPKATTAIPNFYLAGDYVQTYTDLASMEAANEAARRAVNGILDRTGVAAPRAGVWPLVEPRIFLPARALDRIKFALGW